MRSKIKVMGLIYELRLRRLFGRIIRCFRLFMNRKYIDGRLVIMDSEGRLLGSYDKEPELLNGRLVIRDSEGRLMGSYE